MRNPGARSAAALIRATVIGVLATGIIARPAAPQGASQAGLAATPARLLGLITDTSGVPLSGAEIWLIEALTIRTVSSDSGTFELTGLPPGAVTFSVRRLGFEAATFSATLRPGRTHRATFPLTPSALALPGVTVEENRTKSSWLALFEQRRSWHRGTFIQRKDWESRQLRIASDILRMVPGVQVVPARIGSQIVMSRGDGGRRCVPQLYVHTTPYSGRFDDFSPDDIEAVEVYSGISEIPPDLNTMGRPVCAAVVIWTREPPPRQVKIPPPAKG
jgi:hypothetical protein